MKNNISFPGVADLDQVSPDIPMQHSLGGPARPSRPLSMAKTYDYADYGAHQYEELPSSRYVVLSIETVNIAMVKPHPCQVSLKFMQQCRRNWENKLKVEKIRSVKIKSQLLQNLWNMNFLCKCTSGLVMQQHSCKVNFKSMHYCWRSWAAKMWKNKCQGP